MDEWAVRSHTLAAQARNAGFLNSEILPIEVTGPDGESRIVHQDQAVQEETTLEGLSQLKPIFDPEGSITAGNASPLNAGAASMLLMARDKAEEAGLAIGHPLGATGVRLVGTPGPNPGTKKCQVRLRHRLCRRGPGNRHDY
jgi:acetyl-CoA acetyltransferase